MRFVFLTSFFLSFASVATATDCNTHKIYCRIVKLQPKIDKDRAMRVSNAIYKSSQEFKIDPMISVAILFQENRFRSQHTWKTKIDVKEDCHKYTCTVITTETKDLFDIGIAQININTAHWYGFDVDRLVNYDVEYAIHAHFKILKDKIEQCDHLGKDAWSCYHSTTQKFRVKYITDVGRYLDE